MRAMQERAYEKRGEQYLVVSFEAYLFDAHSDESGH